jgi:hypothetical protein
MNGPRRALLPLALLTTVGAPADAADPAGFRRLAVVVGANRGAADRVPLRYAVADAERFAGVVTRMGGVAAADCILLREPSRRVLLEALATARTLAAGARGGRARVEVIVYFSGHADDQGLMLGRELVSYRELRAAVGDIDADVGVTVLDACASGAITRLKGGQAHPAFLAEASGAARGYAFLTSSSETEAAQESDRLQGSFFTHALLTGLRGAADASGDGRVTLGEAYQFAFSETLAQTTTTQAGAQHPAYDIKMAGTGDLVLTDVRENAATLILGPEYDGRFFVLGAGRRLVAELYKPFGRRVELGLEAGEYEVYFEQEQKLLASTVKVVDGARHELSRESLRSTRRRMTRRRGPDPYDLAQEDLLDGRNRFELSNGLPDTADSASLYTFLHWLRPDLALQVSFAELSVGDDEGLLLGTRYYPPLAASLRPWVGAGVGVFAGTRSRTVETTSTTTAPGATVVSSSSATWRESTGGRLGAALGGGADVYLGRRLSLSMLSHLFLVGERRARLEVALAFGWNFGGRRRP